ncbi:MAG: extracellular solute-binding protein [Chloroflexota bacterium]
MAVVFMLASSRETVVVTHWANGHMTSDALLPGFARRFNADRHFTSSGKPIEVRPIEANSGTMTCQLVKRTSPGAACPENQGTGGQNGDALPDPTIVTPAADHWLGDVNYSVGRDVIDLANTAVLARTFLGIATLREMAQCLGWPEKPIGYADIIALRNDPRGWSTCPTARAEWGKTPLISFTDPDSSSTSRSMIYTLYAIAAGKSPETLTQADVTDPKVVEYVRQFQRGVDHYVPDTLILNSKIYLGPRYGHFFFIAEDNLVKLYQGKVEVEDTNGKSRRALDRDMVFIYPREGSPQHNHSAALVNADWVTTEQAEAAQQWIAYLLADAQQQAFMQEGFRPGPSVPYTRPAGSRFWPDPKLPATRLNPDRVEPAAARSIVDAWGNVKKPGVVTLMVDTSGSMTGEKLEQARQGTIRMVDNVDRATHVGLLTFSDAVNQRIPVAPVADTRFAIADAANRMTATGNTALYTALQEAIRMTDEADADDGAIRGVVVLTDGKANRGLPLHNLIQTMSRDETVLPVCWGFETVDGCGTTAAPTSVPRKDVLGTSMAVPTKHPIHVFYVGIGKDADLEVGRILAEATHAAFQATTTEKGQLASVLAVFGKYF